MIDGAAVATVAVPLPVVRAVALVGGHLEWVLRPAKRRILAHNLAHAIGRSPTSRQVRRVVRREVVNEARRSADLLWAIARPQELVASVELQGVEHACDAARQGRGVVLVGLHLGGWELATALPATVLPVATSVIVADDWLAWAMQHVRSAAGLTVLYRSAPAVTALRALRRGDALLVLGDDAGTGAPRLARVRFCDSEADLPVGAVALARLAGAPIVPFSVLPEAPRRWRLVVEPALAPPPIGAGRAGDALALQALADRWTPLLRARTDHWAASFPIAWAP